MLRLLSTNSLDQEVTIFAQAAQVGLEFRTLFNQPEATVLLNNEYHRGAFWKKVLRYAYDGNLQSVLDEYMHVLYESLGLMGHKPEDSAEKITDAIGKAISLRSPSLVFDEIKNDNNEGPTPQPRRIRCRYALRLADEKSKMFKEETRSTDVRIAFNSPFRPFILATTSIGQEGLDFHQYCHRVMHWNLPSNPVDLEQREGRVYRYKCHAIRRNLAKKYGISALENNKSLRDPWRELFSKACDDRESGKNDLIPFWIYDVKGGYKIERQIAILPLSRELGRLDWLKKTLIAYRSVMGQPRQEELLEFIAKRLSKEEIEDLILRFSIDLSPPQLKIAD